MAKVRLVSCSSNLLRVPLDYRVHTISRSATERADWHSGTFSNQKVLASFTDSGRKSKAAGPVSRDKVFLFVVPTYVNPRQGVVHLVVGVVYSL